MSYLVLARKWRPQAFGDVTGQEHVVRTLANAIAQGRLAHAFLLCGPRGVGKTTTARLLARALNCESGPTAQPCGTCVPCREIVAGSSVDVVEIDGASNNGVDSVRELREAARYLPQRDRHKVFIIDEVHMLSVAAFNALLKTLEEPPPHVKFIFATTDPQKLPETILSRVQRHNFRRVPAAKMVGRLRGICDEEGITISDRSLGLIARQADGGMRDALSLLDQLLSSVGMEIDDASAEEALGLVDRTVVHAVADALLDRDGKRMVELLAGVYERGIEAKRLCEELALQLRDLVYVKAVGSAPADRGDAEEQALREQAAKADPEHLARLFDRVHGSIRELSFAAQPRLALEVALLSAVHMAPAQSLAAVAARLEAVAAGLAGNAPSQSAQAVGTRQAARPPAAARSQGAPSAASAAPVPPASPAPPAARQPTPHAPSRQPMGRPSSPPVPEDDLIGQVEALARARAAPRQAGGRAPGRGAPAGGSDDEGEGGSSGPFAAWDEPSPPPFAPGPERAFRGDEPPPFAGAELQRAPAFRGNETPFPPDFPEIPSRIFAPEASPGGCATNECGEPAGMDDPSLGIRERWRRALEWLRGKDSMACTFLSEGRLAWLREGEVAVGYSREQAFFRSQLESPASRSAVEELLATYFGRPTRLRLQDAAEDAGSSVAEEDRRSRDDRARRLRSEAREHPSVLAALSVFGGEIDGIDVLEER
ncbi:DNA polymerase III subunit gamma/tau [Vulgatibacter incomptus]|uniref:DNA polymerase III subunit gamma/tau n=1 Tax=Vulgatibacter incomptus TaxID=1391653 RepID=A0A0K1P826_9BACT|nr:DNA polymerase III subunit gamma/tau [Vulgatibacter incomptus]AKU89688.1 DNA polymerase III subunits gamma and tau [Vulgatibacter incomptus]